MLATGTVWGQTYELRGRVVDADSGEPIPARVYVHTANDEWLFVRSAAEEGSAVPYAEQAVPTPGAVERHTTISAHPFVVALEPGEYEITIERGKQYVPLTETIQIGDAPLEREFRLQRWINMAERGWYSGDTHVHRRIEELPNVMLAEDLNVAFPITYWTTRAFTAPDRATSAARQVRAAPRQEGGHEPLRIDATHVIFPRNTEYEIFTVNDRSHVLGAMLLLKHRTVFQEGAPPVGPIAERAHREGALIDLEKHNWPWSMMLVPIADVDLYELSNNHVWRTEFGFRQSSVAPADYMQVETDERGMTEWGWLNFGFENYYTLLNCGFRLQPTAGTASGVHPVPLGFGRVYVHLEGSFDEQAWVEGLAAGRSFVTTGPMLFVTVNGELPGHTFQQPAGETRPYQLQGEVLSARAVERIELLINGQIAHTVPPTNEGSESRGVRSHWSIELPIQESSWIAVRCFERQSDNRVRFAHTAPFHIDVGEQPVRPRREEVEYLVRCTRDQLDRNRPVLPPEAVGEYERALAAYEALLQRARD